MSSSLGRISVFISQRTGLSRRYVETLIERGCVFHNGQKTTQFALPREDFQGSWSIEDNGKTYTIRDMPPEETKIWAYHKPPRELVTWRDPQGRPTVFEYVRRHIEGPLWSVGRLDYDSTGLLLLTNKTSVAHFLEKSDTERCYDVQLSCCSPENAQDWLQRFQRYRTALEKNRRFSSPRGLWEAAMNRLEEGIILEGIAYSPCKITLRDFCPYEERMTITIVLQEGKNREIRRMMESMGLYIETLHRLSYGPFSLGKLKLRDITALEIPKDFPLEKQ